MENKNKIDFKSKRFESRSRLPRMSSNQMNGQKGSTDTSSIPRPTNTQNNQKIINNKRREELVNTSDNSKQNYTTIISPKTESFNRIQTSSLSKSQSLNEIQYQINDNITKINNFSNGCDSVKAFSFEQLDENFSKLNSNAFLTKDEMINSSNNQMDVSIDESSTTSLGLLPNIMSSSISPFDNFTNIPIIFTENNSRNDRNEDMIVNKNNSIEFNRNNDGDDDSENGIPTIQEEESDSNLTVTEMDERPVTPLLITNALNNSVNSYDNCSLDNTMESFNSTFVDKEMAVEFETMNLDNTINDSNRKSDNIIDLDNRNISETNIPNIGDNSLHETIANNQMINTIEKEDQKVLLPQTDKSSQVIVKSLNANKSLDCNKVEVINLKSSVIRPNSLNTTTCKLNIGIEKVQRSTSPIFPLRKKIKTPGRWDAVMNKIEQSRTNPKTNPKTNLNLTNNTVKGRVNTNLNRNPLHNGSLPKISPLSEFSNDIDSSHLTPSTPSAKSSFASVTKKTVLNNPITTKVNIPKSKTFVRELTANNNAGNKSQQPVEATLEPQPSKKGVVASINDKKTANRRPTQPNAANTTLSSKRAANKINSSTISKKDVRSAQLLDDKQQIQRLTELCELKTKQLKTLGLDQNYMRLAFDSLSIVIQHLIEQYKPFENPQLRKALLNANKRCEQLKDNLDAKNLELNDMKIIFEEQINQLMKEREKNFSDFNQAKVNHETNLKKLTEMHSWEVKTLEDKHYKELQMCQQNRDQLLNELKDKNNQLNQTKQLKDELEVKVIQMEETIMNDKDKRFKYLNEKTKQQELEVESLKVVMDMKNEKIHTLERQMIETQEKINELPLAKETIRGLQQQIENLQVTLERKIHQFNQLTAEHEDLKTEYDREMREKRRLSMKNEELAFHLSESFNSESGFSNCDSNHKHWRSNALITDETPIKTNRAFIASASNSTSIRKHSKPIKSMSSSLSSANSKRGTPALYCHSTFAFENDNSFLSNGTADEVFGNTFREPNFNPNSGQKSTKCQLFTSSDETPPQCILDSGFEEIQGLNSLPK